MVGRGEVLERMTTIAGPQGSLEALWQSGGVDVDVRGAPVLMCPPHPALGGNMDSPVLADLVWMLGRRRHPTLRFNYAGVGASLGVKADPARELPSLVDDAASAVLHLLQSTGEKRCYVVGLSIGALAAAVLGCVDDGVEKIALISPPVDVGLIDPAALDRSGALWRCYVGDDDVYAPVDRLRLLVPGVVAIAHGNHTFSRGLQALCVAVADDLAPAD